MVVQIGDLMLGANYPVRIQSMANTNTMDTETSVEQAIRIIRAGGELVRFTTQGASEAENLALIRKELHNRGYKVPLVADVHFNPAVAEVAARLVEKVRINPGNYADKKQFRQINYTEKEYAEELERIRLRLLPLIAVCKQYGTAIRIGVNHGSLSDRIMSRYGDTPAGMVESAMEFLSVFRNEGYHNLVISMKASNTRVMMQATRMMYYRMQEETGLYPIHLGVTEAGEGEDGRIKSAAGIGALLAEGIGDTIRVSLTEDPELEIPVARKLASLYPREENNRQKKFSLETVNPVEYARRPSNPVLNVGGARPPVIIADVQDDEGLQPEPEFTFGIPVRSPGHSVRLTDWHEWLLSGSHPDNSLPLIPAKAYLEGMGRDVEPRLVLAGTDELEPLLIRQFKADDKAIVILRTFDRGAVWALRWCFEMLNQAECRIPVIVNLNFAEDDPETLQVKSGAAFGALLLDGLGDGIWLRNAGNIAASAVYSTAKGILQACRMRTFKTEYIACPSCGRTLFNIAGVLKEIKARTAHLTHLKIAVMGCIVNGPGEMADADYGYVGAGPDKITLYKGKEVVRKSIPSSQAVDELISLIRANGDWIDP